MKALRLSVGLLLGIILGYGLFVAFSSLGPQSESQKTASRKRQSILHESAEVSRHRDSDALRLLLGAELDYGALSDELIKGVLSKCSIPFRRAAVLKLLEKDPTSTIELIESNSLELSDADLKVIAGNWVRRRPEELIFVWENRAIFNVDDFWDLANQALDAPVDQHVDNISKLRQYGMDEEGEIVGRLGLSWFAQEGRDDDTAVLLESLSSSEALGLSERRAVEGSLQHRWSAFSSEERIALIDDLPGAGLYRELFATALIEDLIESGSTLSLSLDHVDTLFSAVPDGERSDSLFVRMLDLVSSHFGSERALEFLRHRYPEPQTIWEESLYHRLGNE